MKVRGWVLEICFALIFLVSACSEPAQENKRIIKSVEHEKSVKNTVVSDSLGLRELSDKIVQLLDKGDYAEISKYVSEEGLLLSPYVYLDSAVVLPKDSIVALIESEKFFMWGLSDGKGDSIHMPIDKFIKKYIYDTTFVRADTISINQFVSSGNTLNNVKKTFPSAQFVEYYFAGSETYSGMDWQSLIIVINKKESKYYLRALISNEWTI